MRAQKCPLFLWSSLVLAALEATVAPGAAAPPAKKPPAKPGTSKPAAAKPAPAPTATPKLTAGTLAQSLKALGYTAEVAGELHRLKVEEPDRKYGYTLDLAVSKSGDWLVVAAQLAPVPDLSAIPASALLALLTHNDELVGMAFGYQRTEGRVVLNATLPLRGLDLASVRNLIEAMKATVRSTEGLWDPTRW